MNLYTEMAKDVEVDTILQRGLSKYRFVVGFDCMCNILWNVFGRLRGLTVVAHWTTDHYHLSSNLGVRLSEGCFILDFAALPLEVAWPI